MKVKKTYEVSTIQLDDYIAQRDIQEIDLLKIDVEGQEWDVLCGARKSFDEKKIRACIFEVGGSTADAGVKVDDFREFFSGREYTLRNLMHDLPVFPKNAQGNPVFGMVIAERT